MANQNEPIKMRWRTINGRIYEGYIIEMDSNVAHVECTDGKIRCVEL